MSMQNVIAVDVAQMDEIEYLASQLTEDERQTWLAEFRRKSQLHNGLAAASNDPE